MFDKSVSWFTVSCRLITDDETDLGQVYQVGEQGQILSYNSISCFGSHLNSKRLASADKRNSLKQKFKTNKAEKLP